MTDEMLREKGYPPEEWEVHKESDAFVIVKNKETGDIKVLMNEQNK